MAPIYDQRGVTISLAAVSGFVKVLNANRNRVSLFVSVNGTQAVNVSIELAASSPASSIFFFTVPPIAQVFPYRDWGPLITEELWARIGSGTVTLSATEVWRVPNS